MGCFFLTFLVKDLSGRIGVVERSISSFICCDSISERKNCLQYAHACEKLILCSYFGPCFTSDSKDSVIILLKLYIVNFANISCLICSTFFE